MKINIQEYCRVCISKHAEMLSIFKDYKFSQCNLQIFEVITKCASVQIQKLDGFSERICKRCMEHLCQAFSFKQLCEESDHKFRHNLIRGLKIDCIFNELGGADEAINEERSCTLINDESEFPEEDSKVQSGILQEENVKKPATDFTRFQNLSGLLANVQKSKPLLFSNSEGSEFNVKLERNTEQNPISCTEVNSEIKEDNGMHNISDVEIEIKSEFHAEEIKIEYGDFDTTQNLNDELSENMQNTEVSNKNIDIDGICGQRFSENTIINEHDEEQKTSEDVMEEASAARYQMLPEKSKERYKNELEKFTQWQTEKNIKGIDENVMMAYFKNIGAASAWSRYSMLKSTLFVFQNIDISRFCNLTSLLKTKCRNYQPKKASTFSRKDVCKFMSEAPDQHWILQKVVLMMGIFGGCRCDELSRMLISDVEEHFEDANPTLVVKIPFSKTGVARSFTVVENGMGTNFLNVYKKYKERRPIPDGRLFLQCRNGSFTSQGLGVNSIAKIPGQIAEYLLLPDKADFTGYSLRRTSTTLLADSGADKLTLKRHGSWKSNSVAESYVSASKMNKMEITEKFS